MHISRKKFIQVGSFATASMMVPKFLKALDNGHMGPRGNKVVVVLQLNGGNDGLNTIVPYRNDIYYKLRPVLGIAREKSLKLTDEVGINPALAGLKSLYDEGALSILNNVGYPNPDRSHFRSMDIWHTASPASQYWNTGWIGRYLDAQCNGCDRPTQALEIDDTLSLALKGEINKAIALKEPARLYGTANEQFFKSVLQNHQPTHEENPIEYLYKTMAETLTSAEYIFKQSKGHATTAGYPATQLGKDLKTIASLIFSDINTKAYYVSLGSFDTHVNQAAQQTRLFTEMNDAITAFVKDLKSNGRFDDVLLFSFSEFGRRVAQNASGGTDHGTANNMMFISGGLKQKGILNEIPNLADLSEGDLKYNVDFKDVYATILSKWLNADDKKILLGNFNHLQFI